MTNRLDNFTVCLQTKLKLENACLHFAVELFIVQHLHPFTQQNIRMPGRYINSWDAILNTDHLFRAQEKRTSVF